jgi:rfaE bifunctional protein kinase chain/domain
VVWANGHTYVPGGAANVANNIRALGSRVSLLGVIGNDLNGNIFLQQLKRRKIDGRGIFKENRRGTTVKTRIIAGHQQVVRVDWERTDPLPKEMNQKIIKFINQHIDEFSGIIIEDYGKGVINSPLLEELVAVAHKKKKTITVDPKEEHFLYYSGVTAITPNRKELENAVRNLKIKDTTNSFRIDSDKLLTYKDIDFAAKEIIRYLDLESILVTLGEQGMRLLEKNGQLTHIPTVAQEVFDVSGAGDTVISVFTLALASGAKKVEAAHLANYAAGIVVGKLGTAVASRQELKERILKG